MKFCAGTGRYGADGFDGLEQLVLHDERPRLAILDDVGNFGADQPEVDRHGDQAGYGGGGVDFQPLHAVVGEHADAVAFREPDADERVGEPAGPRVPEPEGHRPFEIAGADLVGKQARMQREHVTDMRQLTHIARPPGGL